MSTITLLEQIKNFTQLILEIPPTDLERLALAEEIFAQLSQISDPACQKALGETRVILDLKSTQTIIALKVAGVTERLLQLQQAISRVTSADYAALQEEQRQLRSDIDSLPDNAFGTKSSKEKVIERLSRMNAELRSKNPTAWKVDALAQTLIAGIIGSIYALHPQWIQSNSWLATQATPLFENYGTAAHWGVGLGISLAGMATSYGVEKLFRSIPPSSPRLKNQVHRKKN